VDADDYVDLDFYEKLYNAAKRENADIAKGECFVVRLDGYKRKIGPNLDGIRSNKMDFSFAFTSMIYRFIFLKQRDLDFPVGIITAQDTVFLTKAAFFANKIALVAGPHYNYIRQENSLDSKKLSIEKLKSKVEAVNMIMDFINEHVQDPETYNLIFKKRIDYLLDSVLFRNDTFDGWLVVIRGAIGIWNKCKFKDKYGKEANGKLVQCLADGDEIRLLWHLRNDELTRLENELASERRRRLKLKNSLSWQVTAPVRAIGRALGLPKKKNDT
jgi:hypothetical protein